MECPTKPPVVVSALILLHVMMAAALKLEPAGTSSHIPPLIDCAPPGPAARSNNLSAFRGEAVGLLDALSAAAPPASTGFVGYAQSSGEAVGDDDRAFARVFCSGSGPGGCLECLSTAVQDVADGCHGRRGAVWRAGCFVSYADTNASTAREDAWRGWFYDDRAEAGDSDDTPTTMASGQCMANRTAAECSRCLDESAQVVPALKEGRQLSLLHRNSVVVVGYSCYLRVPLFRPTPPWRVTVYCAVGGFAVGLVLVIEVSCLRFCIAIAQQFNPAV